MAAKPIDAEIAQDVIAAWRTGEFSQRQLADKFNISTGKVAQLTKGVEKDHERIVSAGVEYLHGLAQQDERNVSAINDVVSSKVRIAAKIERFIDEAVDVGHKLLRQVENGQEYKAIIDGVDKASITAGINDRHAKPANIQQNMQVNFADELDRLKAIAENAAS